MLGGVAIFYFFATALAMAVACAGPDVRAKFCSAYLMVAWGLSNRIFLTNPADDALAAFSFWDMLAVIAIYGAFLRWPSRWMALMLAALTTQVIFQAYHRFGDPEHRSIVAAFAANEAMYVLQLISVTIPTIAQLRRRARARRLRERSRTRRGAIPPPYDGWEPPGRRLKSGPAEPGSAR